MTRAASVVPKNESDVNNCDEMLKRAAKPSLTPEEIRDQRVSFVYGMMPHRSSMSREQVADQLSAYYG